MEFRGGRFKSGGLSRRHGDHGGGGGSGISAARAKQIADQQAAARIEQARRDALTPQQRADEDAAAAAAKAAADEANRLAIAAKQTKLALFLNSPMGKYKNLSIYGGMISINILAFILVIGAIVLSSLKKFKWLYLLEICCIVPLIIIAVFETLYYVKIKDFEDTPFILFQPSVTNVQDSVKMAMIFSLVFAIISFIIFCATIGIHVYNLRY